MITLRNLIAAIFLSLFLAACASADPEIASQLEAQADRIAQLEAQIAELSESNEEMQTAEMEADHDMDEASAFEVAVAQYVMDTAGFHAIDEALADSGEIDPSSISTVAGVMRVVAGTRWPQDLVDGAGHLQEALMEFETALLNDDAAAAAPLAGMVHDHQHDLSSAISTWLSGEMPMEGEHEHSDDEAQTEDGEQSEAEAHEHASEEDIAAAHGVPEEAAAVPNPFAGDEESTALGADLFLANCANCHGETGKGDGPSAEGLEKPPADLSMAHVQGLSDGGLFYVITFGMQDTQMPAWEEVLDEDGRWALVNFLRTFKEAEE